VVGVRLCIYLFAISEQVSKDRFKMYCGILALVGWWVWFLLVFLFLGLGFWFLLFLCLRLWVARIFLCLMFFLATVIGGEFKSALGVEDSDFFFVTVEELEEVVFYPKSFIPELKSLRVNRNLVVDNPYVRSAN